MTPCLWGRWTRASTPHGPGNTLPVSTTTLPDGQIMNKVRHRLQENETKTWEQFARYRLDFNTSVSVMASVKLHLSTRINQLRYSYRTLQVPRSRPTAPGIQNMLSERYELQILGFSSSMRYGEREIVLCRDWFVGCGFGFVHFVITTISRAVEVTPTSTCSPIQLLLARLMIPAVG